jgi:hypothetical protein
MEPERKPAKRSAHSAERIAPFGLRAEWAKVRHFAKDQLATIGPLQFSLTTKEMDAKTYLGRQALEEVPWSSLSTT